MTVWKGFFESLKGFIKWRAARNAQIKDFKAELSDTCAQLLMAEVKLLREDIKGHVEKWHGGKKTPPKAKSEITEGKPWEISGASGSKLPVEYAMTDEELQEKIYG